MNPELEHFNQEVQSAQTPEVLFGTLTGLADEQLRQAHILYRRFARVAHADRYLDAGDKTIAHLAFTKLSLLWQLCQDRITKGVYGTIKILTPVVMKSKKATYEIGEGLAAGDLSSVYLGTSSFPEYPKVLIKIAGHHTVNDFIQHEARVLHQLSKAAESTSSYRKFIPTLVESLTVEYKGTTRAVNVFAYQEGYRPLTDVFATYPEGVDQRHFVWIWNRLLTVLAFIHSQKIVHGAILPSHVLVHPETHSIQLIDWCFSVVMDNKIRALSTGYKTWYPPEVEEKRNATAATDLYMAAECMCYILGADPTTDLPKEVHPKFRRLLEVCLIKNPARRMQDAWKLYEEFSDASDAVFGKRRYVKLQLA